MVQEAPGSISDWPVTGTDHTPAPRASTTGNAPCFSGRSYGLGVSDYDVVPLPPGRSPLRREALPSSALLHLLHGAKTERSARVTGWRRIEERVSRPAGRRTPQSSPDRAPHPRSSLDGSTDAASDWFAVHATASVAGLQQKTASSRNGK